MSLGNLNVLVAHTHQHPVRKRYCGKSERILDLYNRMFLHVKSGPKFVAREMGGMLPPDPLGRLNAITRRCGMTTDQDGQRAV